MTAQIMDFSSAEENYLRIIYHLSAGSDEPVTTNAIADAMSTKPASVSDMLKRLSKKKVIDYMKYKGVRLTDKGEKIALRLIRKHRLWEVFLVRKLKFNWDEVHAVAEQLEHIDSSLMIERLDEFLGYPRHDPHGDPIPDKDGLIHTRPKIPIAEQKPGSEAELVAVKDTSSAFLRYLDKIGLHIGARLKILDKIEYDGSLELRVNDEFKVFVSREVAVNLLVKG